MLSLRPSCLEYTDLSAAGSFTEAISHLYEALRWAETHQTAKAVLLCDLLHFGAAEQGEGNEHKEALFDRMYRATSGRLI